MKTKLTALATAMVLSIGAAIGAAPAVAQTAYGWQLMTPNEVAAHRTNLRDLPPAARVAYRARHHEEMKQRAEAMGLVLPDQPQFAGAGRRIGAGGIGPGYGFRGPGGRRCCRW
jgi:hypothetical protein